MYEENDNNDYVAKLRNELKRYLTEKITEEFKHELSPFHMNKFITEIINEI